MSATGLNLDLLIKRLTYLVMYNIIIEVPEVYYAIAFRLTYDKGGNNFVYFPNSLTVSQRNGTKRSLTGYAAMTINSETLTLQV